MKYRQLLLSTALTGALIGGSASNAGAQGAPVYQLDIPAEELGQALKDFSAAASQQIVFSDEVVGDLPAPALHGKYTREQALAILLQNTGLRADLSKAGVIMVRPAGAVADGPPERQLPKNVVPELESPGKRPTQTAAVSATEVAAASRGEAVKSDLEEIVVTGTHIRGAGPVGSSVLTIDALDIDRAGYLTPEQLTRSLPQNFGGGVTENSLGGISTTNTSRASGINLRGLGAGSTLVLLNGRRMAPSGGDAGYTDISSIPLSAVSRVDVLMDGASAIYGSDSIGGVVNFVLRKDYEGAETTIDLGETTRGDAESARVSQLVGTQWTTGGLLVAYQYLSRGNVAARDRVLTANSDLRRFGGNNFNLANFSNPGTISVGGRTYAIPAGQNGVGLNPATLTAGTRNETNTNEKRDLLPERDQHSGLASVHQQLNDSITIFAEGLYSHRVTSVINGFTQATLSVPSTNAFYVNPSGGTGNVSVSYDLSDDLGPGIGRNGVNTYNFAGGAEIELAHGWQISAQGSYSRESISQLNINRALTSALNAALASSNPQVAFNPFGDGSFTNQATLDGLRTTLLYTSSSDLASGSVVANGPVVSVPAGEISVALGGDYRHQSFDSTTQTTPGGTTFVRATNDRNVKAAFAEVRIPIFGESNARDGLKRLEVSVAGRYDDYSDFGDKVVPKVGGVWSPLKGVDFRGTWGKSFKAPNLPDFNPSNALTQLATQIDASGTPRTVLQAIFGGNPTLKAETATIWTAGLDVTPVNIPSLKIGVTYFNINFVNRIQQPPSGAFLSNPAFASLVTLNPTTAQRTAICSYGTFLGANPADCINAPVYALLDLRTQNTARVLERGIDFNVSYSVESKIGVWSTGFSATRLVDLRQALIKSAPSINVLNTPKNPVDLKLRAWLEWNHDGFDVSAFVNYVGSYRDNVSVPNRPIGSWNTVDLQLRYDFGVTGVSWLKGFSAAVSVQNAFDTSPPFFNNSAGVGYDPTNADVIGRAVTLQLRKSW